MSVRSVFTSISTTVTNISKFGSETGKKIHSTHSAIYNFSVENQIFVRGSQAALWGAVAWLDPKSFGLAAALHAIPLVSGITILPEGQCPSCLETAKLVKKSKASIPISLSFLLKIKP